ncbi:MAG: ABC transporter permease [Chloroflexi bacterium]|nr:ABC transporter permease [Chloroflexota bacterium]
MTATVGKVPDALADPLAAQKPSSLWRDTLWNILRQRSAVVGLTFLVFLVAVAVFAPVIATYNPNEPMIGVQAGAKVRMPPCIHLLGCPANLPQHLMGLDGNGRDVFSRVVYGARVSLQIGILTVGFAIILGALIGAIAGYFAGKTDNVLMRLMDVVLAFPSLLLAIAIVTVLGQGLINAQLAIGIVAIPVYARVMRASVLSIREQEFVAASRALGESRGGILVRRVVPNALTPLIVQGTLGIAAAIIDVAALSFLGLGAQPPLAEWGSMIGIERNAVFAAPHLIIFPGLAIVVTCLAFNLLGDGVRDALDPRLNR